MVVQQLPLINSSELSVGSEIMRALAHPLRIQLLNYIMAHEPVKVYQIHHALGLDASLTSQQLKILRDAGIVETRREGKFISYSCDREKIRFFSRIIREFDTKTQLHRRRHQLS